MALSPDAPAGATDTFNFYTGALPGAGAGAVYPANIPNAAGLEQYSSADIASLLNPPSMFPDTSRRAAEVTAGRGVGGSAAAYGTGLRMTDEERIRRIALGEQLLSGAYSRTQPYNLTPEQKEQIRLEQEKNNLARDLLNAQIAGGWWTRARGGDGGSPGGGRVAGGGAPGATDFGSSVSRGLTNYNWTDLALKGGGPALDKALNDAVNQILSGGSAGALSGAETGWYAGGDTDMGTGALSGGQTGSYLGTMPGGGRDTGGMSAQDYFDLMGGEFSPTDDQGGGDFGPAPEGVDPDYWFLGE